MAIATFKRYEMKYLITKEQFDALTPKMQTHMKHDEHCQNGRDYTIFNIYFDTHDSDIIRHSVSKPYYKEKLRLRSYSIPTSPDDKVFLELKKKIGGIVNKRRAVLTLQEANDFIDSGIYPVTTNYTNNQVLNEIAYFLYYNKVIPTVFIGYNRIAFFGKDDKDFRITFDYNITTRRTDLRLDKTGYEKPLLNQGQYLMEVKISNSLPLWLVNILSELKIYKTGYSKYGQEFRVTNLCMNY